MYSRLPQFDRTFYEYVFRSLALQFKKDEKRRPEIREVFDLISRDVGGNIEKIIQYDRKHRKRTLLDLQRSGFRDGYIDLLRDVLFIQSQIDVYRKIIGDQSFPSLQETSHLVDIVS